MPDTSEDLVLSFSPPLVALLLNAERSAGRPLTEAEVVEIRDSATCIAVPSSVAASLTAARGYPDVDPEDCWAQWQQIRVDLVEDATD